jgi:porin
MTLIFEAASTACAQGGGELYRALFERGTLSGDWGGLRTRLEERGIEIGFSNYGDVMGVASGGLRRGTVYSHLVEPTIAIDLDRLLG